MDALGTFIAVVLIVGITALMIHFQREKVRKANPLGPVVLRTTLNWNNAPADIRINLLKEAGVDSEQTRNSLIIRPWNMLDGGIQIALTKLMMIAEFTASSNRNLSNSQSQPVRAQHSIASIENTVPPTTNSGGKAEPQTIPAHSPLPAAGKSSRL